MNIESKYLILKNYFNKSEFIKEINSGILKTIGEISNEAIVKKIKKNGLKKMHHYFNPDYLPFLQHAVKKKTK